MKTTPAPIIKQRAEQQGAPPAKAVGGGGQPERDACVTGQGEGEEQPDLFLAQADLSQVERQYDRQEAVTEQAHNAGGEEPGNVAVE